MCGIFGILSNGDLNFPIEKFLKQLQHRGPDDSGAIYWCGGHGIEATDDSSGGYRVALGHRRLSIIDVSSAGKQPMRSHDANTWIVFNGEVYNYIELAEELETAGVSFRTRTDTEVVLEAIVRWGPEKASKKFVGMFAIATLNTQTGNLTLIRDGFGIKPLFYCKWSNGIAFSSEINALLELPGIDQSLEPDKTWHYLRFGVTDHGETTLLTGVKQVPPGHWMVISGDNYDISAERKQYWSPNSITVRKISYGDAVQKVRDAFLENIRLHLRSDVPIGTALSGGVDSSAIVCAVRYLKPNQEIHTFSYIADDARLSEERWIDAVNSHVGAIPHKVKASADDLIEDIQALMKVQGEPFGSTSIYAQNRVFKEARACGIKVMLDGQGADELLGGYPQYQGARLASLIAQGKFIEAAQFLLSQRKWPDRSTRSVLINGLGHLLPDKFRPIARSFVGRSDNPIWANQKWFDQLRVNRNCPWYHSSDKDYLRSDLKESVQVGLLGLLRYEDRNSMAYSIESRVPFLTTNFAELVLSLPESYLIGEDGTSKRIFRDAMRGIVPDPILYRRDKVGFATPEFEWLKKNTQFLTNSLSKANAVPCLNQQEVNIYYNDVLEGRIPFSFQVWRLLNFINWYMDISQRKHHA